MGARLDPELSAQLERSAPDAVLELVVRLKPPAGKSRPQPDETLRVSEEIVRQAEAASGSRAEAVNVMKNLGVFVVAAAKRTAERILNDDRVESALANTQPSSVVQKP